MNNELIIKKCKKCGASVIILNDCTCEECGVKCCGEKMQVLEPNSFEASAEKHIPKYKKVDNEIKVTLNHPMEKEHYIQWIAIIKENKVERIYLKPGDKPECKFEYMPGSTLYAYCNKHELWKKDVI